MTGKLKTRYEIIIDHTGPVDPEKIGFAISESLKPIMEGYNKKYRVAIDKSVVTILAHNEPERSAIEVPNKNNDLL